MDHAPSDTHGPRPAQAASTTPHDLHDPDALLAALTQALAQPRHAASAPLLQAAHDLLVRLRGEADLMERRLRVLFDAVPDPVTVLDPQGRVVEANAAACRAFGRSPDAMRALTVYDLNPDLPPDRMEAIFKAHAVGDVFIHETDNRRADGTPFPVEIHSAIFLDRGAPRIVAVARDLTARRAAEHDLRAAEARQRLLLDAMDTGVILRDDDGRIRSVNAAGCRILGRPEHALVGHVLPDHWLLLDARGQSLPATALPGLRALREGQRIAPVVLGVFDRDSRRHRWLSVNATPVSEDGTRRARQSVETFSDVTALQRDSALFDQAQALASIGGWEFDVTSNTLYGTAELRRILGRAPDDALTRDSVLAQIMDEDRQRVLDALRHARTHGSGLDLECRVQRPDGRQRWVRILGRDATLAPDAVRLCGTVQDATERHAREDALLRASLTDPLTGLANRDALTAQLERAIARAGGDGGPAVLYIDLDRFKVLNDLLGHAAGDALLVAAARRLQDTAGQAGFVARIGSDEFVVLVMHGDDDDQLEELAGRITAAFARPFAFVGEEFALTTSVGVARHPQDGRTAHTLLNNANAAMDDAKRRGRNTWQLFNPGLEREVTDRLLLETHLRRALELDEFRLVFQPQVDLRSGALVAAEALLRWRSKRLGDIPPDRFIRHAETTGDIVRIGAWVIREACRQMRRWRDAGLAIERVSVNVSYRQFLGEYLAETVDAALREFQLEGSALELEVTERVLIEDAPDTLDTFAALKLLGVSIVIDDFGEGYSALNYLRRLPIDGLKISHAFMQGVPHNPSDAAICQAIIRIAQSLGHQVIAEGVETEAQRRFLLSEGSHLAQGYLYARPLAPEDMAGFALRHPPRARP